ncbi:MAG: EAL domain-containing protein [Cyanobacteria bacterium P01_A01_bin.17]
MVWTIPVSRMQNPEYFEIIRTIITLAHTPSMNVVAEGIQSIEQKNQLAALSCDQGQGERGTCSLNRSRQTQWRCSCCLCLEASSLHRAAVITSLTNPVQ